MISQINWGNVLDVDADTAAVTWCMKFFQIMDDCILSVRLNLPWLSPDII